MTDARRPGNPDAEAGMRDSQRPERWQQGSFARPEWRAIDNAQQHGGHTVELFYEVHDGQGPYLLLVHGFLSSRAQWSPNIAALARVTRPVVVELLGHNRSPAPDDPDPYHPTAYVTAFEQLRQQLGAESWFVCGQSLGAALTMRYALTYPSHVRAQIFTNSSAALADVAWLEARRASALEQATGIESEGHAALEKLRVHPIHARRLPAEVHAALLADAQHHTPRGIARTLRYTTPNAPVRDRLPELQVPTLLVWGEREKRFEANRYFAEQAIPDLQVVGTPAGHAVNIEAAEAFNTAVCHFVHQYT
ncbi:MAG: alpha/beta fold hydrolase [Candidatus Tectimicrobiota bacterium]